MMIGYLYDAAGRRIGKGSIQQWSCNANTNGFSLTNEYVLGQGGEQVTELDGDGDWLHTNAYAGGHLIATYDPEGLHYQIADWLGNRRVQTNPTGTVEQTWQNLPFGELTPNSTMGATEHHFTGKERDAESGLDYFGARYYTSAMGRFLSPDWSAKVEPVPYAKLDDPQSLNLYSYVRNNPMSRTDPTGHATCANPPSCTMSTIDAHPAGAKGPTITFKNNDPNGKSPDQPVTTKTAVMVEKAVIKSGVQSVNIDSTTGGTHAPASNHAKGRAVDIDVVNGTSVRSQGASPAVKSIQGAFAESPDIRENFGPARMEKTSTPGTAAQPFGNSKLTEDHEGHIHESSQP
jgi:RHS repeat-associated protein